MRPRVVASRLHGRKTHAASQPPARQFTFLYPQMRRWCITDFYVPVASLEKEISTKPHAPDGMGPPMVLHTMKDTGKMCCVVPTTASEDERQDSCALGMSGVAAAAAVVQSGEGSVSVQPTTSISKPKVNPFPIIKLECPLAVVVLCRCEIHN